MLTAEREAKSTAEEEAAISDAAMAVLSRYVADGRKRAPGNADKLGLMLDLYMQAECRLGDNLHPPHDPSFASQRAKGSEVSIAQLAKVGVNDLVREWERRKMRDDLRAALSPETVDCMLPRSSWPAVAAVMSDGPELAGKRFQRALLAYAEREMPYARTRVTGTTTSRRTLETTVSQVRRLMNHCVQLAGAYPEELGSWSRVPELVVPRGPKQPTSKAAPPLHRVRAKWASMQQEVCTRLGCEPGGELAVIAAGLSDEQKGGCFRLLRGWAALTLTVVVAPRRDALRRLTVGCFDPAYANGDKVTPALWTEPRKTWEDGELSVKPLGAAAYPLQVFLAYLAAAFELPGGLPDDYPLLPSSLAPPGKATPWRGEGNFFRGLDGRDGSDGCQPRRAHRAVVPRDPAEPTLGYSQHRYRVLSTQMLESNAAGEYLTERQIDVPQRFLASALKDHDLGHLEAVYNDVGSREGRARMAGIASEVLWVLLTTERGARRMVDAERYRRALSEIRALDRQAQALDKDVEAITRAVAQSDSSGERGALLGKLVAATQDKSDVLRDRQHTSELIDRIEARDPRYFAVILDTHEDAVEQPDLKRIRAEVTGDLAGPLRASREPVRDWLTLEEFAQVAGRSGKQVRKWAAAESLPPQGPRCPWAADRVPIEEVTGKRRRVIVAGLSPDWIAADPLRMRQIEELRGDWPSGWSAAYRQAEAKQPGWMDAAGGKES